MCATCLPIQLLNVLAVIAERDTLVSVTFTVSQQGLYVEYAGSTFSNNDTMNVSLRAGESLQLSANGDLTGVFLCFLYPQC